MCGFTDGRQRAIAPDPRAGATFMIAESSVWTEWAATGAALVVALLVPAWVVRGAAPLVRAFDELARKPMRAVALFAVLGGVGAFACGALVQWPTARVHDECSYLLAADTFAAGRLCNPEPPCAVELEAFHVITSPVYASKYPSGQGLALALGQVLGGDPACGLWLMAALFAGAVTWMLLALLPGRWALVGACIALLKLATTTYWAQSFWGGSLTAAGGALAFGALVRIWRRGSVALGVTLGLGIALMALSRPYEGAVACVPLAGALAVWSFERVKAKEFVALLRVSLGAALPLVLCGVWMTLLNRAVTGDPLRMPYFLHDEQYAVAPPFLWQAARAAPTFATREIEEFWTGFAYDLWAVQQEWSGFFAQALAKLRTWWLFFVGAALAPAVLALPLVLRRGWLAYGLSVLACVTAGVFAVAYDLAHYIAPAAPWIVVLCAAGLRGLAAWRPLRTERRGQALVVAVLGLLLAECVARGVKRARPDDAFELQRARLERQLEQGSRKALVIVRYGAGHRVHDDWVYNRADIPAARVVWARDHGDEAHARLRACYPDRAGYLLNVEPSSAPRLTVLWP
jgi:hypothetical protein